MSLDVTPEIENIVSERARQSGVSVNDLLARTFAPEKSNTETTSSISPAARVQALLAQWQAADNTPRMPPIKTLPGETPTRALFREWQEEAAKMSDEEREAEDRLWVDIEKSILEGGRKLRLRQSR